MDVSHPIRSLVPTLDGPVLEVLATTTRRLSGREVHRLAGTGSVRGIQLVLARLVAQGLVDAEEHTGAILYAANRAHLAWPAVEHLAGLRSELFARIRDAAAGWPLQPLHVSVFGSAARRDGDASSDIDLLVVAPDDVPDRDAWQDQVDGLRDDVRDWTGNRCQVMVVDPPRLADHVAAGDPLVDGWLTDGVLLAGAPLATILDRLPVAHVPRRR